MHCKATHSGDLAEIAMASPAQGSRHSSRSRKPSAKLAFDSGDVHGSQSDVRAQSAPAPRARPPARARRRAVRAPAGARARRPDALLHVHPPHRFVQNGNVAPKPSRGSGSRGRAERPMVPKGVKAGAAGERAARERAKPSAARPEEPVAAPKEAEVDFDLISDGSSAAQRAQEQRVQRKGPGPAQRMKRAMSGSLADIPEGDEG
jgi:hypothetical protein